MKRHSPLIILSLLLLFALVLVRPADAGGDVNVCDESHLLAAMAGGGTVTFSCSGVIVLSDGITISQPTVIDGSGQDVTISGGDSFNVFNVNAPTTLQNLTIADGYGGAYTVGGAIDSSDTLIVKDSTITSSFAAAGGGIYSSGTLTVTDSTFNQNRAFGTVIAYGGAIYLDSGASASITNSTFAFNSAGTGGAIWNAGGTLTIRNTTFADNSADSGSGNALYHSGGVTTVANTIIVADVPGDHCEGAITDGGGNVHYPDYSCPGQRADPLLGPLQDNGGPTMTLVPETGSAALDAGVDAICSAPPVNGVDQRGVARPIGAHCDSGSVESSAGPGGDFAIAVDPPMRSVCVPGTAVYDVSLTVTGVFSRPVDLSTRALPAGTTASFDVNPITPPATAQLTLDSDVGTVLGTSPFDIVGTTPTRTHTIVAWIERLPDAPNSAPTLTAPADGATDVVRMPTFTWNTAPNAADYLLEVADDAGFGSLVYTATVTGTTHTAANSLAVGEQYFWRVTPQNSCGVGPQSAVFSFTTVSSDFALAANPAAASVCIPGTAVYDIDLTATGGFSSPVTLSANGAPAGTTAAFDVNPVTPPATSQLTIDSSGTAVPGDYIIDVVGAAATRTHTITVGLELLPTAPDAAPTLTAPSDGATDVPLMPDFAWSAVSGAASYQLELADDAGFSNIIYTANVTETAHTAGISLAEDEQFFWRVTPQNGCGDGPQSAVFSFTTLSAPMYSIYVPVVQHTAP